MDPILSPYHLQTSLLNFRARAIVENEGTTLLQRCHWDRLAISFRTSLTEATWEVKGSANRRQGLTRPPTSEAGRSEFIFLNKGWTELYTSGTLNICLILSFLEPEKIFPNPQKNPLRKKRPVWKKERRQGKQCLHLSPQIDGSQSHRPQNSPSENFSSLYAA